MNLISRVFLLSVCVFTVCALPNLGNLHELQDKLIHTLAANSTGNSTVGNNTQNNCSLPGNNTGAGNNTGNGNCSIIVPGNNNTSNGTQFSCIESYSIQMDKINAETVGKSEECSLTARLALASMNESVAQAQQSVNRQSMDLRMRLAGCSRQMSSEAIFQCYTKTFDENLGNLNNITVQSQVASAALSGYEYEVEITTQACVGKVLVDSKSKSSAASNELQVCMQSGNSTQSGVKPVPYYLP